MLLSPKYWDYRCVPYLTHSNHSHRRTSCFSFLWGFVKHTTIRQTPQFGKREVVAIISLLSKELENLSELFISLFAKYITHQVT